MLVCFVLVCSWGAGAVGGNSGARNGDSSGGISSYGCG